MTFSTLFAQNTFIKEFSDELRNYGACANGATLNEFGTEVSVYYPNIPIAYSEFTSREELLEHKTDNENSGKILVVDSYIGYNARRVAVMALNLTRYGDTINYHEASLQCSLFSYDLQDTSPEQLGINKGIYTFADFPIMKMTFNFLITEDNKWTMSENSYKERGNMNLTVQKYNMETGAKIQEFIFILLSDSNSDYLLFDSKIREIHTILKNKNETFNSPTVNILFNWLDNEHVVESAATRITHHWVSPRFHRQITKNYIGEVEAREEEVLVASPIERLDRVEALNTGAWTNYPLGTSEGECVARFLNIPFNNQYAKTTTTSGITQILSAVNADVLTEFINQSYGVNFADLLSLWNAYKSYYTATASMLCREHSLPAAFTQYIANLIAAFEWNTDFKYGIMNALEYPYRTLTQNYYKSYESAILQYIKEDYSLNESIANMANYLQLYRDIRVWGGASTFNFYTQTDGYKVRRLGASSDSVGTVLSTLKKYEDIFIMTRIDNELNNLLYATAISKGSITLVDLANTFVVPHSTINIEINDTDKDVIASGYFMRIDAANAVVNCSISFVQPLKALGG